VLKDDPMLTARPAGPRTAARIVLDSRARLPLGSRLARTIREAPVLAVVSREAEQEKCEGLTAAGIEVFQCESRADGVGIDLPALLEELGRRRFTNLLVEGGSRVLGSFWDARLIDEAHCFIAPKLIGGEGAFSPFAGQGEARIPDLSSLVQPTIELLDGDVYIHGTIRQGDGTG
jgi:diaminohydroxyphosphoribosylaminopyrimidine deaminase/5-amino-6-(5-phosphoribosylamino)uracil reductase